MAFRFLDLNEDCQRMIIRQLLLENEAKVMIFLWSWGDGYNGKYVLESRRPEANNRLGMTCKAVRTLFEDEAHKLRVFELHSDGWCEELERSMQLWSKHIDLKGIRFLRLVLKYGKGSDDPKFPFGDSKAKLLAMK